MNRDAYQRNRIHSSASRVVYPVQKCPILANWYDYISCYYRDQSTLEPLISDGTGGHSICSRQSALLVEPPAADSVSHPAAEAADTIVF